MSEFKKGQLVAVRDSADSAWHLCVYDHASPEGMHFCRALNRLIAPCWWNEACSAEVVWPDIFLARDRVTIELLQEMRLRLHQRCEEYEEDMVVTSAQIRWLCNVLKNDARTEENNPLCPLNVPWDCEHTPCDVCWEQASLKAVKEKPCP